MNVVSLLQAEKIRAERAFPGRGGVALEGVAAAVQLQNMDGISATVLVNVLSPAKTGAAVCEDAAVRVCQLLRENGGNCAVGQSRYLEEANVFCVPVTAEFAGMETDSVWTPAAEAPEPEKAEFSVAVGGVKRDGVASFTAQQVTDETVTEISNAVWRFTLEESLPLDDTEAAVPEEPFTIIVSRQGRTETYTDCTLTQQKRVLTEDGLRQVRTGMAGSVTVS